MSKKGENIHKRKDGRWEGRYKKGRKENGRIIYGSVYGSSYKEVKEKMNIVLKSNMSPSVVKGPEKRFYEVLELWKITNSIRLKRGSETKYSYLIDAHIKPQLGELKLSQITASMINTFLLNKLQNGRLDGKGGLSPAYVKSIMIVINSVLKFAADEQMCLPLRTPIYKPSVPKKELVILDVEEQEKLENHIINNFTSSNIGIMISLYTGMRIGEICALSWNDIDFFNKVIHVRHTVVRVKNHEAEGKTSLIIDSAKTKASKRDIPILAPLDTLLQQLRKTSKSEYVVSDKSGFISPRTFEARFHALLKCCNLRNINYHVLRHTFATRCIEAGVDVKSLSEILGHSNVSTTLNTYVHSSMMMKRKQLEKLSFLTA